MRRVEKRTLRGSGAPPKKSALILSIVVSGCDCEKGIGQWENESAVDLIIPNAEKKDIAGLVAEWKEQRGKVNGAWRDIKRTDFVEMPQEVCQGY